MSFAILEYTKSNQIHISTNKRGDRMINEARKTYFIDKRKFYHTGTTQQKRTDTEYTTNKTFLCVDFLETPLEKQKITAYAKKQISSFSPEMKRKGAKQFSYLCARPLVCTESRARGFT